MISQFLKGLENTERPLLGPNFWILEKSGMILPDHKVYRIFFQLVYLAVVPFILSEVFELYVIRTDLDEVFTNLKILMLSSTCCMKAINFVFWQSDWKEILDYITKTDREERENADAARKGIIDQYTKYCHRFSYFYWALVGMTFIGTVTQPFIFLNSPSFREGLKNGTEVFPHIFSSYLPYDKFKPPFTWITLIFHTYMCAIGATIMAVFDSLVIVIMVFFGGRLDLLEERCKLIFKREDEQVNDKQVLARIAEIHQAHLTILKYVKLNNSLLSPLLFMYLIGCSLMICTSAIQITSTTSSTQMMFLAEYLVFGITQLFIFCWHSNDVLYKAVILIFQFGKVAMGPYESEWYTASAKQAQNVKILMAQMRLAYVFTAGPFTNLTLPTFITILKGAYSYYTLLRN